METNNYQESGPKLQSVAVDYAAALCQYNKYGRGRLMKTFCGDEGMITGSTANLQEKTR